MADDTKALKPTNTSGVHHVKISKKAKITAYKNQTFFAEQQKMRDEVTARKKREKQEERLLYAASGDKVPAKIKFKRWWYGMKKETRRVAWPSPRYLVTSLLIVILIIVVMTAVFYGVYELFISLGVINLGSTSTDSTATTTS